MIEKILTFFATNYDDFHGGSDQLSGSIQGVLNAIIGAAGLVAVTYVIIGGVKYMTSGGDPGKLATAKNTITYALIGLAVCALAAAIVNFVIGFLK